MARFEEPVMKTRSRAPAVRASSTAYWMSGLSTIGSISFGLALVAGRKRVPRPATGKTAKRIGAGRLTGGPSVPETCADHDTGAAVSRPAPRAFVLQPAALVASNLRFDLFWSTSFLPTPFTLA